MTWKERLAWLAGLIGVLSLTRWTLIPEHLFYFDSVNFALALKEFNPALHQPQPPGYPLFVGFTRILQAMLGQTNPEDLFVLAGILGGAVAIPFLWLIADEMFGEGAGIAAAVLLAVNPVFWFGGLTNQVRVFQAFCTCGAGFFAWRAWRPDAPGHWFYLTALWIGLSTGFRPPSLPLLLPLFVVLGLRRRSPREWLLAGGTLAGSVSLWLVPLVWKTGGIGEFKRILSEYAHNEFQGSSLLFGAAPPPAWKMVAAAVVWNSLGALTWAWLLPWIDFPRLKDRIRPAALFLAVWAIPGFLFQALVHVADPDQTLLTTPIVCLLGAGVLLGVAERPWSAGAVRKRLAAALALVAGLNVLLFLKPPPGLARASSYQVVQFNDRHTRATLQAVRELHTGRPVILLWCGSIVTWRHLSYYFPEDTVLVMEPGAGPADTVWSTKDGKRAPSKARGGAILLPPEPRIVLLSLPGSASQQKLERELPIKRQGPLLYLDRLPDSPFHIGNVEFAKDTVAAGEVL